MLATWVIVFREVLEASLVVGIVLTATRGVAGRGVWMLGGIAGGVLGAMVLAAFADVITTSLDGIGQELFNATVLFLAVLMLGWHNVWMNSHGREMAVHTEEVGRAVAQGHKPLFALVMVVGVAVLREGAEVVLFLYGITASARIEAGMVWLGGLLGLATGGAVGWLLYLGLLRIPARHLFAVTSWLIALLAAGMASHGAGFLVAVEVLPALGHTLWDTSWLLSDHSIPGKLLSALVGYVDRPAGIQVLFYGLTLAAILLLTRVFSKGTDLVMPIQPKGTPESS